MTADIQTIEEPPAGRISWQSGLFQQRLVAAVVVRKAIAKQDGAGICTYLF
jgi:hypothetical protein